MPDSKISAAEMKELMAEVRKEIKKSLDASVEAQVKKQLGSTATKNEIKEITTKVLVNLFRILWNRSSMWEKSV
jgi:FKBP-type peptidyl-prolyl cis-trans isomerase (trigger factor)